MKPSRSIRWGLQFWYGALLGVLLIGLGIAAYEFLSHEIAAQTDNELYHLASYVNADVPGPRSEGQPLLKPGALSQSDLDRGFYCAVWRKNLLPGFAASANAPQELPIPTEESDGFRTRGVFREAFINTNPGDFALVGRSIEEARRELPRLAWGIAGVVVLIWSTTMLIGWWLIGRALRPIHAITVAAERIARGDLSQRIQSGDTETELGRLAAILNSTFSRLDSAFTRQTQFTSDAAHELRTPITVLLTHLQNTLATDDLSAENREALEACQRASQRMRRLIESLLLLARFENHPDSLHRLPVDLAEIAEDALELARPLAEAQGITLQIQLEPTPFFGDADRIGQVITNLLTNALYYNHANGEVHLLTRCDGASVLCVVKNTGPGISPLHLPHIFERFYRADTVRTGGSGRTGLGLAISHAIIDAHQGEIIAESDPGKWTTFTLRLPLRA